MALALKVRRVMKGITQEELAKKSGVSRATISAIERGSAESVTVGTLQKMAKALECKVSDFFAEEV